MKPSIFKNELLATSDPLNTVIFQGLWCLADRDGLLEDRPRRIHLEINAGRAYEGTEAAINWLVDNGFIVRYEVDGGKYIQIPAFSKHQKPHPNEKSSGIPAPGFHTKVRNDPPLDGGEIRPLHLNPSSLNPESLCREVGARASRTPTACRLPDGFSLTEEQKAYARKQGVDPDRELQNFIDYWKAASGQRARKHDWDATWRTWCRRAADMKPARPRGDPPPFRRHPESKPIAAPVMVREHPLFKGTK